MEGGRWGSRYPQSTQNIEIIKNFVFSLLKILKMLEQALDFQYLSYPSKSYAFLNFFNILAEGDIPSSNDYHQFKLHYKTYRY